MSATVLHGVIRDGQVELSRSADLPNGTEVIVMPARPLDDDPMTPEAIAQIHLAMNRLSPFDIPVDAAADLDAWERKLNDHGIANAERGLEDVFP